MALTDAQKLAFVREMIEVLNNNTASLVAGGYDPAAKITELTTQAGSAELAEASQQQAQADAKVATQRANDTRDVAYNNASATVEIMAGVLGKTDAIVQEIKSIRQEMNR
jgi:hypothetical protein